MWFYKIVNTVFMYYAFSMIQLNFLVREEYILQHALSSFTKEKNINTLKHKIWKYNHNLYYLLSGQLAVLLFQDISLSMMPNIVGHQARKNLQIILHSSQFQKVLHETKRYADFVERQWTRNYDVAYTLVNEISRLPIQNRQINVFITHPKLFNGRSYPELSVITWGHSEDWKNYSTVYLWHEIMHHLIYTKKTDANLIHALIELACDNELRLRLNRKGRYFREGKYIVGHRNLINLEKYILPHWKKYLASKTNLLDFEKTLKNMLPKKMLANYNALDTWSDWH